MEINYSFTMPESIAVISIAEFIIFMAVWILMFIDTWRQRRRYLKQRKELGMSRNEKVKWMPPKDKKL
ncbi:TPA: LapA family protein [Salmonella enterica]|uniref:LapA family protein n=1 Tax=Salmonella enterica TaxID=28901 RepID=A0A756LH38_SALER|nr:LapA family protein [Salmonella enterica]